MKTNRKLIALICAISMIFSVFGAFTFTASADGEKGIVLEYNAKASTKTKAVVDVKATGFTAVGSYAINVTAPEGATAAKATKQIMEGVENFVDGVYYNGAAAINAVAVPADGIIMTIEFTLPADGLLADSSAALAAGATIADDDVELKLDGGTLPAASVAIPTDPKATPAPTAAVKPSQKPADEVVPTKAPVKVDKGLDLVYNAKKSTDSKVVIDVKAVGFKAVGSYAVNITAPEGATAAKATFQIMEGVENFVDGVYYNGAAAINAVAVPADGIIMTVEFTMPADGASADAIAELAAGATIADDDVELKLDGGTLPQAWTPVTEQGDKEVKKEFKLSDMISAEKAEAQPASDDVYITVTVDPESAVYGTDYVAYYDGKELGPNEFSNLISGYDNTKTMSEIINNVSFTVYDTGVVKSVSAALNNGTTGKQVDAGTETMGKPQPTSRPLTPSINVTVKPSTVYVGDSVVVTAKVTNPKADGVLTVAASDESLDYVTASGIKSEVAEDNKTATTKFKAADKGKDAVVLNYTYTYTDANGDSQTINEDKKITIKEKIVNNDNTSDKETSSGGGVIANGIYGPTGTVVMPGVSFTDLGEAPWASEAISVLASKNIINGRDEYTFDPNANITRAEYCQILIGAIGQDGAYADAQFDDVSTDAWFYHSVAVASQLGIVSGYGDGNFGPYDLITRQDMALMTMKATQAMNKNLSAVANPSFADDDQIAEYAYDAVHTLAQAGIINGMDDGTFAPRNNATRAQAALIIYTTFVK